MSRKKIEETAEKLGTWMASEPKEFNEFVLKLLSSLPLSENTINDIENTTGIERWDFIGWKEQELIENMLKSIENQMDGKIFWNKLKKVI